jgi:O-antigen/teichoic acid export membrane protein
MSDEKSEYKQIVKATSIFGGVQVFNILISLIRGKIVAVLIGPAGMGIFGLYTTVINLFNGLTGFGIGTSAVKDIAEANSTQDSNRLKTISSAFSKLVWLTGLGGTILLIVTSPIISQWTFGNSDFTWSIVLVSITLLFAQLTSGNLVILQGLRKLKDLALTNVIGSAIGLIITIPLYYYFGIKGIVPAIILTSMSSLVISIVFGKKIKPEKIKLSFKETLHEGKNMLQMGFVLSINGLVLLLSSYLLRIYILNNGDFVDVGLYNAGFGIVNGYVGMIFTAMLTDYYPRLSAANSDVSQFNQIVNQQADFALHILAPIITVFQFLIQLVIIILLSDKFLEITVMVQWAMLGIFFKAASWPIGFIFVPKGDSKLFLISELIANLYLLILSMFGYKIWGITGLGISFFVGMIIYFLQVSIISYKKYGFVFKKIFYLLFVIQLLIAILSFIFTLFLSKLYLIIVGVTLISISLYISINEINKKIPLISFLKTKFAIFKKR